MNNTDAVQANEYDHDVVVVGGGPAGCSTGVFCAREGLDTVIFDRGRSSTQRYAHLENYLGFSEGIDIETFYDLLHDHAVTAGCPIIPDLVDSVDSTGDGEGFRVEPQEDDPVTAERIVAATRYDGEYLRGLDDEWADRERWVEWFDEQYGEDAPVDPTSDRFQRVRDANIGSSLSSYVPPEEIDDRTAAGQEALAAHLDAEHLAAAVDAETLLDHVDDELIREYVADSAVTEGPE